MNLCFYCAHDGNTVQAVEVAHDRRGCVWVCHRHSVWRETTSHAGGHGQNCPEGFPAGSGPVQFHRAKRQP
jgi:hypothetical protein